MSRGELVPAERLPSAFGGSPPTSLVELRPLVASAFEAWLSRSHSEKTRRAYRQDVEQFLSFHGLEASHLEQMSRMVPDDVTAWRDHLMKEGGRGGKPASNATVARKITAIRSFFSYLQVAGYRGPNPAHANFVSVPKVPDEGITPAIHPKLLRELLEAPNVETPSGVRDRAILAMFAYMALRVDELHRIEVSNILEDGEHTVVQIHGKGNDTRRGVMPPLASGPVRTWIARAGIEADRAGPLFRPAVTPRGKGFDGFARRPMTIRSIQKLVKKYCRKVGIDQAVSVHSLRVSAATEADKAGVPLVAIQKWLGHRDPRTTLRYIRGHEDLDRSPAYVLQFG